MKKLLLIALIALAFWSWNQRSAADRSFDESGHPRQVSVPDPMLDAATTRASPQFKCDGRQYCSQMKSRAEAVFFIRNCPNTKMDGDRDGVPCENDSRF